MNANELTYGIEIECTLPLGIIEVGNYTRGVQVLGLPAGWVAKRDGSIRTSRNRMGAEIVSPVLRGADGLRQIQIVVTWLRQVGANVNRSTGFHVHVGWAGDEAALARLAFLCSNHEKALYASTGTKSRERGHYCRPVRDDRMFQLRFLQGQRTWLDRYHLLNLTNLETPSKRTVEFRCFAGTLNLAKILGHIRMCLAMVEKAIVTKRQTEWVSKTPAATSPIHRSGEGQTELTRLFYALGWTKGRQPRVFGDVGSEGLPTIADAKKALMKMARKYDAQQ